MVERPIIFSGPMVRAILEGRKTQTRRILKGANHAPGMCLDSVDGGIASGSASTGGLFWKAPLRFAIGDRLWVRESFVIGFNINDATGRPEGDARVWYRADGPWPSWYDADSESTLDNPPWKSPIHMPRWASRITLAVTDIRVQRVQDISEADAVAEGVLTDVWSSVTPMLADPDHAQLHEPNTPVFWAPDDDRDDCICSTAKDAYGRLWNSIHGDDAWDMNEWVVAITFERAA